MNIKRLKNGNFEINEKTLRELVMCKSVVDVLKDDGYDIEDIELYLEDYVDDIISDIE